jgi:nitroreductase
MKKPAHTRFPVNPLSLNRWSPRSFSSRPVEAEKLRSLFETARWAPSAMNEQPWRFLIGRKPDRSWQLIFETLAESNQVWASSAPVLILVAGRISYTRNNKSNENFMYDTGQAVAHLTLEAVNQGLFTHQMGGFDKEKAMQAFLIPEDFRPLTVVATGYYGDPELLPAELLAREKAPRKRKEFYEFVFSNKFGEKSSLF